MKLFPLKKELGVIKYLWGIKWRKSYVNLQGKSKFVLAETTMWASGYIFR